MGIGYVQGGTRLPPDYREGGAGGELYLVCLWKTLNYEVEQPGNVAPGHPQANGKPDAMVYGWCTDGVQMVYKAMCKPYTWEGVATHKPPQSQGTAWKSVADPAVTLAGCVCGPVFFLAVPQERVGCERGREGPAPVCGLLRASVCACAAAGCLAGLVPILLASRGC
jgi:hypothetical protein